MNEIYGVYMNRALHMNERECLMNAVSEERRAQVNRFGKLDDAVRGLIGEMLVRSVIRDKFHIKNEEITFAKNRYGKPYAVGLPSFHFNVSHSGRWIVCVVAGEPVGIDIEEIKPVDLGIAKHFFSPKVYQYIIEKDPHLQVSYFYEVWTMKESFVKWVGRGLSIPPASFSINMEEDDEQHSLQLAHPDVPCHFKRLKMDPEYKLAVCCRGAIFSDHMILKTYDEFTLEYSPLLTAKIDSDGNRSESTIKD